MMAQRKDMMRIIRQDAGFSAKLEFGGTVGNGAVADRPNMVPLTSVEAGAEAKREAQAIETIAPPNGFEGDIDERRPDTHVEAREEEAGPRHLPKLPLRSEGAASGSAARGQVVYVAVSLATRQSHLAEAWATAARCSVQFLIRRVAQALREEVFYDWERDGMPEVDEPRGTRGKHPTSVTLTLRPQFAADLAARHDPLGILGLARVIGPAFRARFHEAFDRALAKAKIPTTTEADEK